MDDVRQAVAQHEPGPGADALAMRQATKDQVALRTRQKIGKYRIERRLSEGSWATVYQALDTIEGIRVALKIPHARLLDKQVLDEFRSEVRLTARLDHPNILPLKNASFIDGQFVLVFPLGERTLADRIRNRISARTALDYSEQLLRALAHSHRRRVIHCDVKPENLILFPGDRLRLTDFGIAKLAQRTLRASGSGTIGYVAPEQAMGQPSFRSDVFSAGLVLYRMFSGHLPEWPYEWPLSGHGRIRTALHPDMVQLIRKCLEVDPRRRFHNADEALKFYRRIKPRVLRWLEGRRQQKRRRNHKPDWRAVRRQLFLRAHGADLKTRYRCQRCEGPVAETMQACPWCGTRRQVQREETSFPLKCPRCRRGMKLDWRYCPWCYGPGFEPATKRELSDARYEARCSSPGCPRKVLMPFMRYCPWCHRKVRRSWRVPGSNDRCSRCGWGIYRSFWDFCAWCGKSVKKR